MNYLFFDIEGANSYGGVSKICSFGYVLTNEEFEVLEQKDILVNPRSKFNLGPNIKLAYEKDEFKAAGDFTKHYEEIRAVLLQPDVQIFGFAVDQSAGNRFRNIIVIPGSNRYIDKRILIFRMSAYRTDAVLKCMRSHIEQLKAYLAFLIMRIHIRHLHQYMLMGAFSQDQLGMTANGTFSVYKGVEAA